MSLTGYEMTQTEAVADLLTAEHVALKLRAANKPALLAELARRAAGFTGLGEATLSDALAAREALGSTGFGAGIAVPHAKIDGLPAVFGFFARLEKPVAFDSIDGKPVDLVFLLLSPAAAPSEHLAMLAAVSRRLRDRPLAEALRAADTAEAARALFVAGPVRAA